MNRILSKCASRRGCASAVDDELVIALNWMLDFLVNGKPRAVLANENEPPVLVFTDGACEGDVFSIVACGGIIFHPSLWRPSFSACMFPPTWCRDGKTLVLDK